MNKQDIISYFNSKASTWDERIIVNEKIINTILDNIGISDNMDILDVASGTGVMIPFYLNRNVSSVTAIDLSPEMVKQAQKKFSKDSRVNIICDDVCEYPFNNPFDAVVVYNAFPHFSDPAKLIQKLSHFIKEGGTLSVCHGLSRERINSHHDAVAKKISRGLIPAEDLKKLFLPYFDVNVAISNDMMYQVSGKKK